MGIADRDYMRRREPERNKSVPPAVIIVLLLLVLGVFLYTNQSAPPGPEEQPQAPSRLKQTLPQQLGSFKIESGAILITNPKYDLATVEKGNVSGLLACLKGDWLAVATIKVFSPSNQKVCAELLAYHQSVKSPATLAWTLENFDIEVEGGEAGFFDRKHFKDVSILPKEAKGPVSAHPHLSLDLWYSYCHEITSTHDTGGVLPYGVVVNSGYGDGNYDLYSSRDASGQVVALKLVFVTDQG